MLGKSGKYMSDPVTNSEVENVLASIRRLVGEPKKPSTENSEEKSSDRLVLTPQQRVSEPETLQLTPENEVDSAEEWDEFEEPPLSEGSDPAAGDGTVDTIEGPEMPEKAESTDRAEIAGTPETIQPSEEPVAGGQSPDSHPADAAREPLPHAELSAKIAALETAIARTQDQWEPDGDARDTYAGSSSLAMRWQDDVELDGMGKPIVGNSAVDPGTTGAVESEDDEQIIDENTLRLMVTEIVQQLLSEQIVADAVRKELQGDLGTRISQNIRKLVRREIHLALTAKGLE